MDTDVTSAKQCINCLNSLLRRLYSLEKTEWLEQALVARVYIAGKYPPIQTTDGIKDLKRLLDGRAPAYNACPYFHRSATEPDIAHLK